MALEHQLKVIFEKLDRMDKRLFMDNGGECIQSKVNRHDQMVKTQEKRWKWILTVCTGLFMMVLGRIIYDGTWQDII